MGVFDALEGDFTRKKDIRGGKKQKKVSVYAVCGKIAQNMGTHFVHYI